MATTLETADGSASADGTASPSNGTAAKQGHKQLFRNVAFLDIDGTLVHYPKVQEQYGSITAPSVLPGCFLFVEKETGKRHKVLKLPPTSTGVQGVISVQTLTSLARFREAGVRLVLITGARFSTLLQRLPYLPAADAFVCENGGRIFYADSSLPTALQWSEDMEWRKRHNATAGPPDSEVVPPSERRGPLWELYRQLVEDGWHIDAHSYTTAFRIKAKDGKSQGDLDKVIKGLPEGLASSYNLGLADVYPSSSGKEKAAEHLMQVLNASTDGSVLMCDDDNDLGLAKLVSKVFVPGMTSESMREAAEADRTKFVVAHKGGTLATDELLQRMADHLGTFVMG